MEQKIEALLFYKNEPIAIEKIAKILDAEIPEVKEALNNLGKSLGGRGISLIQTENDACLVTSKENSDFIEKVAKDEMSKDIGKAGLETLAIILYNGPISRREIDYIRGVNSTFILRNLSMRGLVERESDGRGFKYKPTVSLYAHLGIKQAAELPDYNHFLAEMKSALQDKQDNGGE